MSVTELVLEDVTAGYARLPIISQVSLTVTEGSRIGLLGRNGAGKTTTLTTAMGLTDLIGGRITLNGMDLRREPTFRRSRLGLGYVPQGRDIFPSLTVEENLLAALMGQPAKPALEDAYRLFPRLRERRSNGGSQLSGGEQQMLAVARALVAKPKLLLLDEPLEGLAPQIRDELMDTIRRLTDETGVGCLLVEQHVDAVLEFAATIMILENGRPVFLGSAEELRAKPDILDRTIGLAKA